MATKCGAGQVKKKAVGKSKRSRSGQSSRAAPRGCGAPLAALGPPPRPLLSGRQAPTPPRPGEVRGPPRRPPALPRLAYLGHGCLPLGPALGHRIMPQGTGHRRPAGAARTRGEGGAGDPAARRLTPSALRMRERPGPAPPAGQEESGHGFMFSPRQLGIHRTTQLKAGQPWS